MFNLDKIKVTGENHWKNIFIILTTALDLGIANKNYAFVDAAIKGDISAVYKLCDAMHTDAKADAKTMLYDTTFPGVKTAPTIERAEQYLEHLRRAGVALDLMELIHRVSARKSDQELQTESLEWVMVRMDLKEPQAYYYNG